MLIKKLCAWMTALIVMVAITGLGQSTVEIPDTYDSSASNTFTVADGSVVSMDGVFVVFEGELSLTTNITAQLYDDKVLASTQIYLEMILFVQLPDVDLFTNSQAAVVALFDGESTTDGTLYALSKLGSAVSWVQLTNKVNSAPIAITAGATNLITIVLRYPGTGYTDNEYTVSISEYDSNLKKSGSQVTSQNLKSITAPVSAEIAGLSLRGEGAVASMSTAAGDPSPLSSRIDFSVYQTTNGLFLVDIYTVDEKGTGDLTLFVLIDGEWKPLEAVAAQGSGNHHYQFYVTGLTVGQSYRFKVEDEAGNPHFSCGEITVKSVEMQAVQFELEKFTIQFNSEESRKYTLVMSSDLNAPLNEWTVEEVEVKLQDGSWSAGMTVFQGFSGGITQISVPKNKSREKAFFKILLLPDDSSSTGGNTP